MDIISHGLWANLVFKELPAGQKGLAVFFGMAPDLISFSLMTFKHFIRRTMHYTEPPLSAIPKHAYKLYNITHSLVIWLGIFFLLKILGLAWLMLAFCGWGFHILLDIFTHTKTFFPTPIFWPFSNFSFSGINWANKWFMLFNYAVLLFMYLVFYF